jgi:Camelysin metallo-endopeptidase
MLAHTEPLTGRHAADGRSAERTHLSVGQPMPSAAAGRPRRPAAEEDGSPARLRRRNKGAPRQRHGSKNWLTWRRLLAASGFATAALALACLVTGSTFGRLSASATGGHNSFTAGTVTLANGAVANCPVSNLLPGSTPVACTFTASYTGTAAYLAVNVLIETQAGSGGTKLYNPGDSANDLQVTVTSTSPSVTYTVPTSATTCPGGAPAGSSCYELDNELVSTSAVTSAAATFSVSVSLPTNSATGYQGGTAQVMLTTHAVQAQNNTLSCSAAPAAGSPCTPSGTFAWS